MVIRVRTPDGQVHDRDCGPAAYHGPGTFTGSLAVPESTDPHKHEKRKAYRALNAERVRANQRAYRARQKVAA